MTSEPSKNYTFEHQIYRNNGSGRYNNLTT